MQHAATAGDAGAEVALAELCSAYWYPLYAYVRRSGRNVEAIDFYQVLALYKLAVISEGIFARFLQGKTYGEGFDNMVRAATGLAQRALTIADCSANSRLRG